MVQKNTTSGFQRKVVRGRPAPGAASLPALAFSTAPGGGAALLRARRSAISMLVTQDVSGSVLGPAAPGTRGTGSAAGGIEGNVLHGTAAHVAAVRDALTSVAARTITSVAAIERSNTDVPMAAILKHVRRAAEALGVSIVGETEGSFAFARSATAS